MNSQKNRSCLSRQKRAEKSATTRYPVVRAPAESARVGLEDPGARHAVEEMAGRQDA